MSAPSRPGAHLDTETRSSRPRTSAVVTARALWLVHSPGVSPGLVQRFPLGALTKVGRAHDVGTADSRLSRTHFVLRATGVHHVLENASRSGTCVDGQRIYTGEKVLEPGCVLRAGDSLFVYADDAGRAEGQSLGLVGNSAALCGVVDLVRRAGPLRATVLLRGETGTGKEVVARAIHQSSGREGRFVAQNVTTIPPTLFASHLFGSVRGAYTGAEARPGLVLGADRGTLFLDEVGELPLEVQPGLLRLLEDRLVCPVGASQERECDVRFCAATNVDLDAAVRAGRFRQDLLARLRTIQISLPPLRARREDVLPLFWRFVHDQKMAEPPSLSANLAEHLLCDDWPDNVRGLRSFVLRVSGLFPERRLWDLDVWSSGGAGALDAAVAAPQRGTVASRRPRTPDKDELIATFREHDGVLAAAARHYRVDPRQLRRWLAAYGLRADDLRSSPSLRGAGEDDEPT